MQGASNVALAIAKLRRGAGAPVEPITTVPPGLESTSFFSPIPSDVRALVPILHSVDQSTVRKTLSLVVQQLKGNDMSESDFLKFQQRIGETEEALDFSVFFTGLHTIMEKAIRTRIKLSALEKELSTINVPEAMAKDLLQAVKAARVELEQVALTQRPSLPTLDKLRWRTDVTISTSSLSHVLKPSITMQVSLSDGRVRSFETSIEEFNRLRYTVAKLLADMQSLERHPMMRIATDLDKRELDASFK